MPKYDPADDFDNPPRPFKRTPSAAELYMIAQQQLEKKAPEESPAASGSTTPASPSSANPSASTPANDSEVTAKTAPATTPNPAPATNPSTPGNAAEIDPTPSDPYVERCMQALRDAEKAARTRGGYKYEGERVCTVERDGKEAFKRAIPPLNGEENIRGFIACVTQAMILGIFNKEQGTGLLYAAQVAHSAGKRAVLPTRSPGRPLRESNQPVSARTALSNK
jgi:hypothetical protein